ncbi:hypothetical protein FDG66_gp59 [Streptomyces phage phiCAM]|uniref:Uncharacterized protein n=1 Tax=Streptomyces phage phiCAM TaxID=1239386 RepID=K4NX69_9CAUD|nr:hypothetical protein FDG66_gp59 [Streptomyces phage phiCAM]AFV51379.1 hypothetical protein [Streptomyces phage phiCAM]
MPWVGNEFRGTVDELIAEHTYHLWGQEHDEAREALLDLVKAARWEAAQELAELDIPDPMGRNFYTGMGVSYAAQYLNPYEEDPK